MWNDFKRWYTRNSLQITWLIIGWLCCSAITNFAIGNYLWAIVCSVVAYVNYKLRNVF
jgi:hypothetical protein